MHTSKHSPAKGKLSVVYQAEAQDPPAQVTPLSIGQLYTRYEHSLQMQQ